MLDDNGKIYLGSGLSGRASVSGRQYLTGDTAKGKLRPHLDQYFPHGAVHHATDPVGRALKHKAAGGQMTLMGISSAKWRHVQQYAIGCQRI